MPSSDALLQASFRSCNQAGWTACILPWLKAHHLSKGRREVAYIRRNTDREEYRSDDASMRLDEEEE